MFLVIKRDKIGLVRTSRAKIIIKVQRRYF